jgi:CRISPR-associated protein Cmr4
VGAGSSVGAIDQPIIRERHTGFPIIPATTLKGVFADEWNERVAVITRRSDDGKWLFGETDAENAAAGAIQFCEARLLAFPIRSAKGSFAWITCPLILARAARDGVLDKALIPSFPEPTPDQPDKTDELAFFTNTGPLALAGKVVIEEYTFTRTGNNEASEVGEALAALLPEDPVWKEVASRLVILSNGMMSFFAQNACEVAQHVRIDDETGTAASGALFNQENVPSETLFYSVVHSFEERTASKAKDQRRDAENAIGAFSLKLASKQARQFGGDASTGLGYCTVKLNEDKKASEKGA